MPQISGVPTLDPVAQPKMSPSEAGRPGAVLSGMGEELEGISLEGLQLEGHIRKAQEHVDNLAARNQLDAAYTEMQNQLAKTQNSRDVPQVLQQAQDNLNEISKRWSESPAALQIQMDADSLRPDMGHIAQMRQIDLLGKEFKVTLDRQGEQFAKAYASARGVGDEAGEKAALAGFTDAVQGGVKTGLMGDIEAQEAVRLFRQGGQELEIKNAIANPDPNVNQSIYDQMNSDPSKFPDVTPEFLDTAKAHALDAKESHIKHQQWADGQMALNVMLRPLIAQHTNPATGKFDGDQALADVAERFEKGDITIWQKEALDGGVKSFSADVDAGLKKQAIKIQDDIIKEFHARQYEKGYRDLEAMRPWLENSGYSELYKGLMNYGDTMQRQDRSEEREERALAKQQWQDDSYQQFVNVQAAMSQGKTFRDDEIYQMAGHGPGKLLPQQVTEALQMVHSYQKDPEYQTAISLLESSLLSPKLPKNATPEQISAFADQEGRNNKQQILTLQRWQKMVEQKPNEDKLKLMKEALAPAVQQQITDQVNQIFGATPVEGKQSFGDVLHSLLTFGWGTPKPRMVTPDAPGTPAPKNGDQKKNAAGDDIIFEGGEWRVLHHQ